MKPAKRFIGSRFKSCFLLLLAFAIVFSGAVVPQASTVQAAESDDEYVLSGLAHPYLFFTEGDAESILSRLDTEAFQSRWEQLLANASSSSLNANQSTSRESLGKIGLNAFAYAMTNTKSYADKAIDEAIYIAGLSAETWAPEAFYTKGAMLDTAEYALAVALVYDWCYDQLSAEQRTTLLAALNDKAFAAYAKAVEPVEAFWVNYTEGNWMGVLHGGIGLAALAVYDESEAARRIAGYATAQSAKFIERNMGVDGNGTEGHMYLRYGQEYATLLTMAAQRFYGVDTDLLTGLNAKLAGYSDVYLQGSDGRYANFNDMYEETFQGLWSQGSGVEAGPDSALNALYETLVPGGDTLLAWAADNGGSPFYFKGTDPFYFLWRQHAGEAAPESPEPSEPSEPSESPEPDPGETTTLAPAADAFTFENAAYRDSNYGVGNDADGQSLRAKNDPNGNSREAYLKFDLSGITDEVTSAKLRLYLNGIESSPLDIGVYGVDNDSWTEGGITWNNRPSAAVVEPLDVERVSAFQYYEFDVTSFVSAQTDGAVSLQLKAVSEWFRADFSSREGANPPQLVVGTGGEAPPAPTPAPVQTLPSVHSSGPGLQDAVLFRDAGYGILSSDSLWFAYNAGDRPGNGHRQFDNGTFILVANGERLVQDPGYNDTATDRHSTVTINGKGQEEYNTNGDIIRFGEGEGFQYIASDNTSVYDPEGPLDRFIRHAVTVDGKYVVLLDDLKASSAAVFESRVQSRKPVSAAGTSGTIQGTNTVLHVVPASSAALTTGTGQFASNQEGTVNYLSIRPSEATNAAVIATVLYPTDTAGAAPVVTFENGTITITGGGVTDTVVFSRDGEQPWQLDSVNGASAAAIPDGSERSIDASAFRDTSKGNVPIVGDAPTWMFDSLNAGKGIAAPSDEVTFLEYFGEPEGPKTTVGVRGTPDIDGLVDPIWRHAVTQSEFEEAGEVWMNQFSTIKPVVRTLWDEEYFYVLAEVEDELVAGMDEDDSLAQELLASSVLEVYLDQKNNKDLALDSDDLTLGFAFDGTVTKYTKGTEDLLGTSHGITAEGRVTDKGYIIEARIPWTEAALQQGTTIGYDVSLDEYQWNAAAETWDRKTWVIWNDATSNAWQSAYVFGNLILMAPKSITAPGVTPLVDGVIDESWSEAAPIAAFYQSGAALPWIGVTTDIEPSVKTLWDEDYLYVLADVKDSTVGGTVAVEDDAEIVNNDSIELHFDMNNDKDSTYQSDDFRFAVDYLGQVEGYDQPEGIIAASAIVEGYGYVIEVAIPWEAIEPAPGTVIGFEVSVSDNTAGEDGRSTWIQWNDPTSNAWQYPYVFGNLELGEVVEEATPTPTPSSTLTPTPTPTSANDGAVIKPVPKLDSASGAAVSVVTSQQLGEARGQAAKDANGVSGIDIRIPAVSGAKEYRLELPASAMSGDRDTRYSITTPVATLHLSDEFLSSTDLEGATSFQLNIASADTSGLSDELRRQIGNRPVIDLHVKVDGKAIAWNNPNAPVTVEIDYKPTAKERANPEHIVVWYIDGDGVAYAIPNAKFNAATGKITFTTTHFSQYAVAFVQIFFDDLDGHVWAKKAVEVLAAKGVLRGTAAGVFAPSDAVTRGEFAVLLTGVLELNAEFEGNFADVAPTDYYYRAAGVLKQLGIAQGTGDNAFNPNGTLTRQDMMVLVAGALQLQGQDAAQLDRFRDASQVSGYAKTHVSALVAAGIVQGSNGRLHPLNATTRAESAVLMYNLLNR